MDAEQEQAVIGLLENIQDNLSISDREKLSRGQLQSKLDIIESRVNYMLEKVLSDCVAECGRHRQTS